MDPITFRSQIYQTGGGARFVTIPTAVRGMQARSNVLIRNCSGRRSKYNCQFLQRSTNTNQSRESGNVDKTSAIRCVYRRLVLMERAGSDAGDVDVAGLNSKCVSRDKDQNMFQSRTIACYTRERVKREEKKTHQRQQPLFIYNFVCHPRTILHALKYHPNHHL